MAKEKDAACTWIVGVCHSEGDAVDIERVYGTKEDIKEYLYRTAVDLGENCDCDPDTLPLGPEEVVERPYSDNLYVGPYGYDFHIDIEAVKETPAKDISGIGQAVNVIT